MEYRSKKFVDELNSRQQDAKLVSADRNLESLMAMRDRRSRKYGIKINESFGECGDDPGYYYQPKMSEYHDDRYLVTHEEFPFSRKFAITKDNRTIYSHDCSLVQTMLDYIDLRDPSKLPAAAYVCPNCANISSAEELASTGCPYCGTHFSIPELYPKVSHFTYNIISSDWRKNGVWKRRLLALIVFVVAYIFFAIVYYPTLMDLTCGELMVGPTIGYFVLLILAALIPTGICYGVVNYIHIIKSGVSDGYSVSKKYAAKHSTDFSTGVFEKTMEQYGPIFNFNYFSSKVYNLLGSVIYAEDMSECPFYNGPDFIGKFDEIIDYVPYGMEILKFDVFENGICTIESKILADTYAYADEKILHRRTEFRVRSTKNMNYPIDINFSAHTYSCAGCSASYDAVKTSNCPYCGRPHDILDQDWYIDGEVICNFL